MFVTNCLSYLDQVDEILVMENGCLVKQGPYSSLDLNEYFKTHETCLDKENENDTKSIFFCKFYILNTHFFLKKYLKKELNESRGEKTETYTK